MRSKPDWLALRRQIEGKLSDEERRIIDLLIEGKSTPEIAKSLGQHRSMVWRKVQSIRQMH